MPFFQLRKEIFSTMDKENQIAKKPIVRPKKPRSKNDRKDIAMDQGILLVNNTKECQAAVKQLRLYVKFRVYQFF